MRRVRRPLSLLALTLLVACSSTTPTATPTTARPTTPTTSSPAASPTPGTPESTPSSAGSGTTTSARKVTPPPAASATTPTLPGVYTYEQEGTQSFGGLTFAVDPEGSFTVSPARGTTQETVRKYSSSRQRDATVRFDPDAISLVEATERVRFGADERSYRCKTAEPIVLLPLPARVGASWTGGGSCDSLTVSYDARIDRTELRTIQGARLSTFVVKAVVSVRGDGLTQDSTLTMWFSPDHRIIVRQVESSTGSLDGTPFGREFTETLRSLRPN